MLVCPLAYRTSPEAKTVRSGIRSREFEMIQPASFTDPPIPLSDIPYPRRHTCGGFLSQRFIDWSEEVENEDIERVSVFYVTRCRKCQSEVYYNATQGEMAIMRKPIMVDTRAYQLVSARSRPHLITSILEIRAIHNCSIRSAVARLARIYRAEDRWHRSEKEM